MPKYFFSRPAKLSSHEWVGKFAACLMQIEPRVGPVRAVRVAVAAYARESARDPHDAAQRFARQLVKAPAAEIERLPPASDGASTRYRQRFGE
jgi:hypothetical protein